MYGIPSGRHEDTMIKGWSVYAELPAPKYPSFRLDPATPLENQRDVRWRRTALQGCALDSAVTSEICNAQDSALTGARWSITAR
jgi:hypothetical protein